MRKMYQEPAMEVVGIQMYNRQNEMYNFSKPNVQKFVIFLFSLAVSGFAQNVQIFAI